MNLQPKVKEIQLKILHRVYSIDSYVSKFQKEISEMCRFCSVKNDILHWFVLCDKVKPFWQQYTVYCIIF